MSVAITDCMQTCNVKLKWQFSSIEDTSYWSIDNVLIGNDSNPESINRRELRQLNLSDHHTHKRQTATTCKLYYENYDYSPFRLLYSSISGGHISNSPCGLTTNWLLFDYHAERSLYDRYFITPPLDLEEINKLSFYLFFANGSNGCYQYRNYDRGIFVDYKIGINGSWINLRYFDQDCCPVATIQEISLPLAAQRNNVYLRWEQRNLYYSRRPLAIGYDAWAIDELYIGNNILYQDTFNSGTFDDRIWLSIVGGSVNRRSCYTRMNTLYFSGNDVREAVTHYFNVSQAESFSVNFYLFLCNSLETNETIKISWRTGNDTWSLLEVIPSLTSEITLGYYNGSGIENIQFKISQTVFSSPEFDTWSIDDFEIFSYNASSCSSTPIPKLPPTLLLKSKCNYYFDNFNDGAYKSDLWYTISGIKISFRPCWLHYSQHYAMEFYAPTTRELTTQMLDLRGVNFIKFYLFSGSYDESNNCYARFQYYKYLSVSYNIANNGIWYSLENFQSDHYTLGTYITIRLPVAAQVNLVRLRWLDQSNVHYSNQIWILDDIEIGEGVKSVLYKDSFSSQLSSTFWSSVVGGSVRYSHCGVMDQGPALYFSGNGVRESITQFLDLRQADAVSFYIMSASNHDCNWLEHGETVELSIRAGYGNWVTLQSYPSINLTYCNIKIPENMKVNGAQLRWRQTLPAIDGYDVWFIDSIEVHNIHPMTDCSVKCIYDDFNSGVYNTSVWNSVIGAQITLSLCNLKSIPSKALYFNQENVTRQAVTHYFDLQGMYAISFYLQIVKFENTCKPAYGEDVIVHYSISNNNDWIEIERFGGIKFATETFVTVSLPLNARNNSVSIRIAQPYYSSSVWSIDDFGVYSSDQCSPLLDTDTTTNLPPTPTLTPSTNLICNYYWDNFDSGAYKSTLWSSLTGIRIVSAPCQPVSTLQRYGAQFVYGSREIVTHALDLRGVELISFYLVTANQFGCTIPSYYNGIYVSYRIGIGSPWNTLEYFKPGCCINGKYIIVYLPLSVQVQSVYLRWSQPNYSANHAEWTLDDVQIGSVVESYLFNDQFTNNYDFSLWTSVLGAIVIEPPCGETYSGNALYFSESGRREAITNILDLRDARKLTFYIRIGSSSDTCEQPEEGEDIELSYRINYNYWIILQTFSALQYRNASYVDIAIETSLQVIGVQFRFRQLLPSSSSYDVWSIDNFAIVSVEQDTKCSMACYSDNFNSGFYNSEFWSSVVIASVMIPPCSLYNYEKSLYFTAGGTREAITNSLDLRGLYAITFTLQIGSYDNKCDRAEVGYDVILYYLLSGSSNWVELRSFDATAYITATTITVPIPHKIRLQGTKLRWAQPQHSGSLQDTWFIDNVGVYSPNQCPPIAYSNPTTNPTIIPSPIPNVAITCNYYFDNFNTMSYKTNLWQTVNRASVELPSCVSSAQGYAMVLSNSGELITQKLNLRKIESIKFFSQSCINYYRYLYRDRYGNRHYGLRPYNSTLAIAYKIFGEQIWHSLEAYNSMLPSEGNNITLYLPKAAQVDSVQIRWWQIGYNSWVLDDIQIGENVHTILYQDYFTNGLNPGIWSAVIGGSVSSPSCGTVDNGMALFFSQAGIREAITDFLDLRQAHGVSFYILTTFFTNCNGLDNGETIELSIRAGYGDWITLHSYGSASSTYIYEEIPENMKVSLAQLRWMQTSPVIAGYDIWAIDSVELHSSYQSTACSVACFADNFNSGAYNASIWSVISGAQLTTPPCSSKISSKALYFNNTNTRHAITHFLDLRGMYAISFYLQIVRSDKLCAAINESNVVVFYNTNNNHNWIVIGSFNSIKFVTETFVTVPLPREARNQSVSIRIAQPNYSGSVFSIDNFAIYSPNQCPPLSVTQTSTITPPTTPTPSNTLNCNHYLDNFDSGTFKSTLWSSQIDAKVGLSPCRNVSGLLWYSVQLESWQSQLTTHPLDLRGVHSISFYLISGNGSNGCIRTYSYLYVSYRIGVSSSYNTLEYFMPSCCSNGKHIVMHIPTLIQVPSVYLRWHTERSSGLWVLDNVKIGNTVETILYNDEFRITYDSTLWAIVLGAIVIEPPCGETYSGNALYFSESGRREAITNILDLRDARKLIFYIRIGSSSDTCEQPEEGEDIELSYRINYNYWIILQTFSALQ